MEVFKCLGSNNEMFSSAMRPEPVKELGTVEIAGQEVRFCCRY